MVDKHELKQVADEFIAVFNKPMDITYKETRGKNGRYGFFVTVNGKEYAFSHDIDASKEKAQIKFFTKNDVYDALFDYTGISIPWGSHTGVRPVSIGIELLKRADRKQAIKELVSLYRMDLSKAKLVVDISERQKNLLNESLRNIDIYISIPFCVSRCSYCSFSLVGIEKKKHLHRIYVDNLCKEIEAVGKEVINCGYTPRCIYIGGGTPTAISPELLSKVLEKSFSTFGSFREVTLEAGRPDTIYKEMLEMLNLYQINRFNINPQSMNNKTLEKIGRKHTREDVERAVDLARKFGYDNINMDIIAGLPGENIEDFKETVKGVLAFEPEDITIHTFALKRASRLKTQDYKIKGHRLVDGMLEFGYDALAKKNYFPYYLYRQKNMEDNGENVGFCKEGKECLYNIDIMEENTHILALGSGGVSKRIGNGTIVRRSDPKDIEVYIDRIDDTIKKSIEFFR